MSDQLVLASASPRRKELLASAGFTFEIDSAEVDETPPAGLDAPGEIAAALARRKAEAVIARRRERDPARAASEVVLAADTVVWLGGRPGGTLLGKPADAADARRMLGLLSGRRHVVATGWHAARVDGSGRANEGAAVTRVLFRTLEAAEIDAYVATGEPFDKAGGYAIQGKAAAFVQHLEGSYSGVMGLPLFELAEILARLGFPVL